MDMSTLIANLISQRDRFFAFVKRRVQDDGTAEDILQAAYAKAISRAETLSSSDSAEAWFFRILRNSVIDHYRHRAFERRAFEPLTPVTVPPSFTPETAPANTCQCLSGLLQNIPPSYQEILNQIDLDEMPLEAFARQAGITTGNAAVRVHRARRSLKKKLVSHCGHCARNGCLDCTCRSASKTL